MRSQVHAARLHAQGRFIVAAVLVFVPARLAGAQRGQPQHRVLDVPGRFATIQQAIDSSRHGDTVLVAPGRYFENIRFKGRNIVVTSHFARTRDLRDIERTIIDGSRPAHPDTASVVRIVNQEDSTAVLQGFTITGGRGTVWLDAKDHHHFREGGGILCELSAPTIRFNYIEHNDATEIREGVVSAGGGGIRCGYAEPTITNNVIRGNRARYGAGIVIFHSAAVIRNNLIVGNAGGEDYGGGGLWVVFPLSRRLGSVVEFNTIVHNRVAGDGRPGPMRGLAGGVWTNGVIFAFAHNVVWGNAQSVGDQFDFSPDAGLRLGPNIVQGGINGGPPAHMILLTDPRFADSVAFTLAPDSPGRAGGREAMGAYAGPLGTPLLPTGRAGTRRGNMRRKLRRVEPGDARSRSPVRRAAGRETVVEPFRIPPSWR